MLFKKCVAEFIGTYCLVFAGTGAIVIDQVSGGQIGHLGIALTFGLIVLAMIYALGDISGAHLNPAVTIGFWTAGRFPGKEVIPYVSTQIVGAVVASLTLLFLFPGQENLGATLPAGTVGQSFLLELILSAMLMFVIISVSTGAKEKGLMAGIAIGATVGLEALFAGPICGASMNPARSLGPALVSGQLNHLWLYLAAPVLGAMTAIVGCKCIKDGDCCQKWMEQPS